MSQHYLHALTPRTAGVLYLAIAVCGGFSIGYVPQIIIADTDSAATVANLMNNLGLFKLGVLADIAIILLELVLTAVLYVMFRQVSPVLASLALIARAGMIVVMGCNLLIWVFPLTFVTDGSDLANSAELVQHLFAAHGLGIFVWQLFFGMHLFALGGSALRAPAVPRLLAWGLFVGGFGYLVQGIVKLAFIDVASINLLIVALLVIVTISELGFAVWLLAWGNKRLGAAS
ncbi:DUF4386 domain-containing protein [Flavimaricola marinus]|uniref:DUF4386 domain-containing protein n=1 Tax=Flavimaricola marinus TaxID=1819565 RepID=A0A238LHS8_9RHOB|nr:DUF4386 domain-containing protein [Flavimaricola marinus]SMY08954.1 hypothetical protein LOM8899_03113 [Flavimaricola marinus]